MFSSFKVPVVGVVVIVLAVLGGVVAADFWSGFIDAASVVVFEVFTFCVYEDEPVVALGENAGELVE